MGREKSTAASFFLSHTYLMRRITFSVLSLTHRGVIEVVVTIYRQIDQVIRLYGKRHFLATQAGGLKTRKN